MIKSDKFYLLLLMGSFIWFQSCKEDAKRIIKTEAIMFAKEGELSLYRAESDSVLADIDIEFAESSYETETGLMYRKSMAENHGMLFIFPDIKRHFFHMKNTEFALDIIFIDENLKIASFQKNTKPFNEELLPSGVPVQYVLEINAGLSEKWQLKIGDRVEFTRTP